MMIKLFRSTRVLVYLAGLLVLPGCKDRFFMYSSTHSETKWGDTHTVNERSDGTTRSVQYSGKVVWDQGKIVEISPGCVIHLSEKKSGKKTVAEIREKNGEPVLWMKVGQEFRIADTGEKAWLEQFLRSMERASSDVGTVESTIKMRMANPEDVDFLTPLRKISFGGDKAAVLKRVLESPHITPGQQVAVVQSCFEDVSFSSDQVSVLLVLLKRPDFSPAAKKALRAQVDRLSFDSDKITILKALSAK
jgi:hypothetical protein